MHNQDLQRQLDSIHYVQSACAIGESDDECRAHWVRYLCVMTASFLETSFQQIYEDYHEKMGRRRRDVTRVLNPTSEDFQNRVRRYNHQWQSEFLDFFADSGRDVAIDSIMRLRHQIAHRGESNLGMAQFAEYFPKCVEVIEFIEERLTA